MILFETQRLQVCALDAELCRWAIGDRRRLQERIAAGTHPDWPLVDMKEILPSLADQLEQVPGSILYGGMIIDRDHNLVIGDVGFHQLAGDIVLRDHAAEVGYSVVPEYRGKGIATEALLGLVEWGSFKLGLERVYAHCDRTNLASIGVLRKAGFQVVPAGLDQLCLFERRLSPQT